MKNPVVTVTRLDGTPITQFSIEPGSSPWQTIKRAVAEDNGRHPDDDDLSIHSVDIDNDEEFITIDDIEVAHVSVEWPEERL